MAITDLNLHGKFPDHAVMKGSKENDFYLSASVLCILTVYFFRISMFPVSLMRYEVFVISDPLVDL